MDRFVIVITNGVLTLRQRPLPILPFTTKVAEWSLHEHSVSDALLLAEQKMDAIERQTEA